MRRSLHFVLFASLLLGGCSRALPFNFAFSGTDGGGQGHNDLSVSVDLAVSVVDGGAADLAVDQSLPDDLGPPSDLSKPGDLAAPVHDLTSSADLRPGADLRPPPDLGSPDMTKILNKLGGACTNAGDCIVGLGCLKTMMVGSTVIDLPGGYCSLLCNDTAASTVCTTAGGTCYDSGGGAFCVRGCGEYCPANRNLGNLLYGCCDYQASPSGASMPVGCLPLSVQQASAGYSCSSAGTP